MLTVTRTWNAVTAAAYLRRGLALARSYAEKREAFGDVIINHRLHQETLADLQARLEGMVHLSFRLAELLGRQETDRADETDEALLRLLTPIAKLTTAKQAVAGTSEVIEAFGGAGYVEDTGLPPLLRDAQVLPIWEGTTNVLALDLLRAVNDVGGVAPIGEEFERCLTAIGAPRLQQSAQAALDAFQKATEWLRTTQAEGPEALQAIVRAQSATPWSLRTRPGTLSGHSGTTRTDGPPRRPSAWPRTPSIISLRLRRAGLRPWHERRAPPPSLTATRV